MVRWPWMSHVHARVPILNEMQRRINAGLKLYGKTVYCKRMLREKGGMWDEVRRCWLMPDEHAMIELGATRTADGWQLPEEKEKPRD